MNRQFALLLSGVSLFLATLAYADNQVVLYHNDGIQTSEGNFLLVDPGISYAESFVLQDNARVNGFHLELTGCPGLPDGLTVGVAITTEPFGGTIYALGTYPLSDFQLVYSYQSPCATQNVFEAFVDLGQGVRLQSDTYYLQLYNLTAENFGGGIYWSDPQGHGPSDAYYRDQSGNIVQIGSSQWFNVVGTVPEPSSWLLLGSGLLGIGSFAKRRFLS